MLDQLPVAMIIARRGVAEMHSALPNSPVVVEPARAVSSPRTYRTRAAVAARLSRIADLVAPTGVTPTRRTASSR
jgi:hypothetical protein